MIKWLLIITFANGHVGNGASVESFRTEYGCKEAASAVLAQIPKYTIDPVVTCKPIKD